MKSVVIIKRRDKSVTITKETSSSPTITQQIPPTSKVALNPSKKHNNKDSSLGMN